MGLVPNGRTFEVVSESHQFFLVIITRTVFITTNGWTKTYFLGSTRLAPNESTFKGLQNYLRFLYFYENLLAKLKVRLFFYLRGIFNFKSLSNKKSLQYCREICRTSQTHQGVFILHAKLTPAAFHLSVECSLQPRRAA